MTTAVVSVRSAGSLTRVITVAGELDAAAAQALVRAATFAASSGVARLEIDLRGMTRVSVEAVLAITACRRLADQVPGGIGFRVDRPPDTGVRSMPSDYDPLYDAG